MAKKIQRIRITENNLKSIIAEAVMRIITEGEFNEEVIELDEVTVPLSKAEELAKEYCSGYSVDRGENEIEIEVPGTDQYLFLVLNVDGVATSRTIPSNDYDVPDDYDENTEITSVDGYFDDINGNKISISDDLARFLEDNLVFEPSEYDDWDDVYGPDPDEWHDSRMDREM